VNHRAVADRDVVADDGRLRIDLGFGIDLGVRPGTERIIEPLRGWK